jgi:hypothetical protein
MKGAQNTGEGERRVRRRDQTRVDEAHAQDAAFCRVEFVFSRGLFIVQHHLICPQSS